MRQRVVANPQGAASAASGSNNHRPAGTSTCSPISNNGVVEAYRDSCFESPTRFYTVAPEHPKLGKWATPSTLKYSQPTQATTRQQALVATHRLDVEASISPAATRSRQQPRPASSSPVEGPSGDGKQCARGPHHRAESKKTVSSAAAGGGGGGGGVDGNNRRPISPAGAPRWGGSGSPPLSPSRGRRSVPRIHTPVSGRVSLPLITAL